MRPARILSVILHPVLMPMAGMFILLTFGGWLSMMPVEAKRYIYLITGITTIALPMTLMPLLKFKKIISAYSLSEAGERRIPLLIFAFLYLAGAWILQKVQAPLIFALFLNGSSMIILVCTLINWKWKISIYMAALGGLTSMIMAVGFRWMLNPEIILAVLFILAGLAGYARLKLDQHTPAQVYVGYVMGFIINFLIMRLL